MQTKIENNAQETGLPASRSLVVDGFSGSAPVSTSTTTPAGVGVSPAPSEASPRYCVDCGAPVPTVPGRVPRRRCSDCRILHEHRHGHKYDFIPREYRGNGYDTEA